jgi:hypothetical protein
MASDFELALSEISDENQALSRPLLAGLSTPTRPELRAFVEAYMRLSVDRRRDLLMQMVEFAEENFEINFDELFRHALSDADRWCGVTPWRGCGNTSALT